MGFVPPNLIPPPRNEGAPPVYVPIEPAQDAMLVLANLGYAMEAVAQALAGAFNEVQEIVINDDGIQLCNYDELETKEQNKNDWATERL